MSTILYYRTDNNEVQQIKNALLSESVPFIEVKVGDDMLMEDFIATFPNNNELPFVNMNGIKLNGYRKLVEHLLNRPSTLYG